MKWISSLLILLLSLSGDLHANTVRVKSTVLTTTQDQFLSSGNITTITTSQTLTGSMFTVLVDATAGPVTVTVPACSNSNKKVYNIKKIDSSLNAVTLARSGSDTFDGDTSIVIYVQNNSYTIHCGGGTVWYNL